VMLPLFFLLAVFAWDAKFKVEVRNSEVWLTRNGQERQLTRDGKSKIQAVLSPNQNRIAYYEQCPTTENCTPAVSSSILTVIALTRLHQGIKPFLQANPAPAFSPSRGPMRVQHPVPSGDVKKLKPKRSRPVCRVDRFVSIYSLSERWHYQLNYLSAFEGAESR
jgi:hypothetical protein